jgi:hypothetical protein
MARHRSSTNPPRRRRTYPSRGRRVKEADRGPGQQRLSGLHETVVALCASGMTTREIERATSRIGSGWARGRTRSPYCARGRALLCELVAHTRRRSRPTLRYRSSLSAVSQAPRSDTCRPRSLPSKSRSTCPEVLVSMRFRAYLEVVHDPIGELQNLETVVLAAEPEIRGAVYREEAKLCIHPVRRSVAVRCPRHQRLRTRVIEPDS